MAARMIPCSLVFGFLMMTISTQAQFVPGFFNVAATPMNRGGRVNFAGMSLGNVCKQIMLMGGKEALSDGMGAAAKWFAKQNINVAAAGGADGQMRCLYRQATGSLMPGMIGKKDPGNMFGDYFDTVIEYPMILDPCTAPQCNGDVNPTVLLMRKYAMQMRGARFGGMGGMMGGMQMSPFGGMRGMPGAMPAAMPAPQSNTGSSNSLNKHNAAPGTSSGFPGMSGQPGNAMVGNIFQMLQTPQFRQLFSSFMNQGQTSSTGQGQGQQQSRQQQAPQQTFNSPPPQQQQQHQQQQTAPAPSQMLAQSMMHQMQQMPAFNMLMG